MEWKEIFKQYGDNWIDTRETISAKYEGIRLEELYQMFKARFLDEQQKDAPPEAKTTNTEILEMLYEAYKSTRDTGHPNSVLTCIGRVSFTSKMVGFGISGACMVASVILEILPFKKEPEIKEK